MYVKTTSLLAPSVQGSRSELIWARLGDYARPSHVWFGLGLLSDLGLPIDALQMFLAARHLRSSAGASRSATVLLADAHALSSGADPAAVSARAAVRAAEVKRIGALIGLPVDVVFASQMDDDPAFREVLASALAWCSRGQEPYSNYTIRGVADVLYLCREGGVKVGWTRSDDLVAGRGRHHEHETDGLAAEIEPGVRAAYVRHGVTLDSKRPTAVPYTEEVDARQRLMLTGAERGCFEAKLLDPAVSTNRRNAVLAHLAITVSAFEALVSPLDGNGPLEKAVDIVTRFDRI